MTAAAVSMSEPGVLRLSGVLDYTTGAALRSQGKALIAASRESRMVLDCSAVTRSSSVGLALLLSFIRDAEATGKFWELRGLPQEMRGIAEVYDLGEVLRGD